MGGKGGKERHKEKTSTTYRSIKTTMKLFPFHHNVKQQAPKLDTLNNKSKKFTPQISEMSGRGSLSRTSVRSSKLQRCL